MSLSSLFSSVLSAASTVWYFISNWEKDFSAEAQIGKNSLASSPHLKNNSCQKMMLDPFDSHYEWISVIGVFARKVRTWSHQPLIVTLRLITSNSAHFSSITSLFYIVLHQSVLGCKSVHIKSLARIHQLVAKHSDVLHVQDLLSDCYRPRTNLNRSTHLDASAFADRRLPTNFFGAASFRAQ